MEEFKERNDPRLRGWLIRERPRGHYRFYYYLYWRQRGQLKKQYVPLSKVKEVKEILRKERMRRKRIKTRELAMIQENRNALARVKKITRIWKILGPEASRCE